MHVIGKNVLTLAAVLMTLTGGAAYWWTTQGDEVLRGEILRQCHAQLPGSEIGIQRAQWDFHGRVHLHGFSLRAKGDARPWLTIRSLVLSLDRDRLVRQHELILSRIHLDKPDVTAIRRPNGRWNWQELEIAATETATTLPALEIDQGEFRLLIDESHHQELHEVFRASNLSFDARPASAMEYALTGSAESPSLGNILVKQGRFHLKEKEWSLDFACTDCLVNNELVDLLNHFIPQLQDQLARSQAWVEQKLGMTSDSNDDETDRPEEALPDRVPIVNRFDLGAQMVLSIQAKLAQTRSERVPRVDARATVVSGQMTNALLPFPLFNLQGTFHVTNDSMKVEKFQAQNGMTQFMINGAVLTNRESRFDFTTTGLSIDARMRSRLPLGLRKVCNTLGFEGKVNGNAWIMKSPGSDWNYFADLTIVDAEMTHERFPYTLRGCEGSVKIDREMLQMSGHGRGEGFVVNVRGLMNNPGPEGDAVFDFAVDNAPLTDALVAAAPHAVRSASKALELQGTGSARMRMTRPPGLGQRYATDLWFRLSNGSASLQSFPYRIEKFSGLAHWQGQSIHFQDLRGEHDGAVLKGHGEYSMAPHPGQLDLTVQAENGAFDRQLYQALPASLQSAWREINPRGRIDLTTVIRWTPGTATKISIPSAVVSEGEISLRQFPYPLRKMKGEFRFDNGLLTIRSLSAEHEETRLRGRGEGQFPAHSPWRLRFDEFFVDDLVPTATFRRSLPESLRKLVDTFDPTGRYSSSGPVEFAAPSKVGEAIRASWNIDMVLDNCGFNTGSRVEHARGHIDLTGRFDGQATTLNGTLELESLEVLGHQVQQVRGPFSLADRELTVGHRDAVIGPNDPQTKGVQTGGVTGKMIDGTVTLDAVATVSTQPEYQVKMALSRGSLEEYARQYMRGQHQIRGALNGWLYLRGQGMGAKNLQGEGRLLISPAELYELPVIVQMFDAMRTFQPGDRTAFRYADLQFRVADERFVFEPIDLVGSSLSFRGRGYVRFDGFIFLDFYSMVPQSPIRLPLITKLVDMFSRDWIGVEVRGSVGKPVARVVPFPAADIALREFLTAFEPRPAAPAPTFFSPPRTGDRARGPSR